MDLMRGGRLLDQGGYGCIFDPPLICRGDKAPKGGWKRNRIGKLVAGDDIKNEILAAMMFKNRPEAKKYFIMAELNTLCPKGKGGESPIIIGEQKDPAIRNCEIIDEYGIETLNHYEQEFGGKTLKSRLIDMKFSPERFPFFRFMSDMLEIGAYMVMHGLIHNDLHSKNVLLNDSYKPRLIDFGRCYAATNINKEIMEQLDARYDATVNQVPPEMNTMDGLAENLSFKTITMDFLRDKDGLRFAEQLFGQSKRLQVAEFAQFWKTSKCAQAKDYLTFWKLYWPSVDAWSIGYMLANILNRFSTSRQFMESDEMKLKFPIIKTVICGLLKASPRKRLDCLEALALYDPMNALVTGASGRKWLTKKEERRKAN